jgi:hypothetical protein
MNAVQMELRRHLSLKVHWFEAGIPLDLFVDVGIIDVNGLRKGLIVAINGDE